jgi:hypothetical protein
MWQSVMPNPQSNQPISNAAWLLLAGMAAVKHHCSPRMGLAQI